MNNSHSEYLLGLYKAIFADVRGTFPRLHKELERDEQRLHSLVKTRGLRVITLDLPAVGKEFDRSLSEGRLLLTSSYLTGRRSKDSPIPRLFGGLVMLVFDKCGMLRVNPDDKHINAVRFLRQLFLLGKKWQVSCAESLTFKEVREFFRIDEAIQRPTLPWDATVLPDWKPSELSFDGSSPFRANLQQGYLPGFYSEKDKLMQDYGMDNPRRSRMLRILQQVADRLSTTLGMFDPTEALAKHGPGAVSDLKTGSSKYEFPTWSERLEGVFPMADFGFANFNQWADFVSRDKDDLQLLIEDKELHKAWGFREKLTDRRGPLFERFKMVEHYSRLIAVPKTQKGPRLIASEPTANQWCQQVIKNFLYDRASKTWVGQAIDFGDQTKNQVLALAASRTGEWSTIDLSSASDRISCWVVERIFRSNSSLLRALHATRTLLIRNPIDKKCSTYHRLNKFTTMGNACTFPVQSLVFLCVCLAAAHFMSGRRVTTKSCSELSRGVRVFGDDIIVATELTDSTLYLLQHLGFKVNHSKTYSGINSHFRESCGVEAYNGQDVTPIYALTVPRQTVPDSYVSNVATAHNFFRKKLMHAVAFIRTTTIQAGLRDLPWVECDSGIFGWPSPMGFDVGKCKVRHNPHLQIWEYLARRVISRVTRLDDRGPSRLLQYFTEAPKPEINWSSGVAAKGRVLTRPCWVPIPA
ncbi:MAG: putative replicase protein [Frobavirus nemorishabitans]|uniref:RNA-directed RNA polymerase n=1 Tax=Leviviridae sp. TaxID=2027243 RepID=A0ABY3SUV6_9VIRU|nr:MAG: putative replicase protein [Leviviridae sp.]